MGLNFRHYLFEEDGRIRRIPRRVVDDLVFGHDALPEYAGTRQRVAEVLVESEKRKAVRIVDGRGRFWDFDKHGKIDVALQRSVGEMMEAAFRSKSANKGVVVDLVPEIKKRAAQDRDRWSLTAEDLDRVAADIWPGFNGAAQDVTPVKGVAPKKPALTYSAKRALLEIASDLHPILFKLAGMTEHDLKGFAFEARRTSTFSDKALWEGIGNEADRLRAVKAAHRTGRGEWYAIVEAMRISDDDRIIEELTEAYEKCSSRDAAIVAGKRLMLEKADWLSADVRLEVCIRSALEWEPAH